MIFIVQNVFYFTNNEVHFVHGLSLCLYEFKQHFFQSPENNATAKLFDYCFNIIFFFGLGKVFCRLRRYIRCK